MVGIPSPVALPNSTRSFTWMQANRPGFKNTHKLRGEIVHLLKELAVVFIMSEIIIGRRIFVVVGERDTGYNQSTELSSIF